MHYVTPSTTLTLTKLGHLIIAVAVPDGGVNSCFQGNRYEQEKLLKQSHTLYVGNLSFYTTEEQVGCTLTEEIIN